MNNFLDICIRMRGDCFGNYFKFVKVVIWDFLDLCIICNFSFSSIEIEMSIPKNRNARVDDFGDRILIGLFCFHPVFRFEFE